MWKLQPPPLKKVTPPLSQQPPSESWGPLKPPLFENLVGGSTPPAESGGMGGAHYGKIGPVCTLWKCPKAKCFLTFSGEMEHWAKIG